MMKMREGRERGNKNGEGEGEQTRTTKKCTLKGSTRKKYHFLHKKCTLNGKKRSDLV